MGSQEKSSGPLRKLRAGVVLRIQESLKGNRQGLSYSRHDEEAWVALTELDPPDIGEVDLRLERQLLLGEPSALAMATDILSDDNAPVSHCEIERDHAYSL